MQKEHWICGCKQCITYPDRIFFANFIFLFCSSSIFSSTVSLQTNLCTTTSRFCPTLYIRSAAWDSSAGFLWGHKKKIFNNDLFIEHLFDKSYNLLINGPEIPTPPPHKNPKKTQKWCKIPLQIFILLASKLHKEFNIIIGSLGLKFK